METKPLIDAFAQYLPYGLQALFCAIMLGVWRLIKKMFVTHEDCRKCQAAMGERMTDLEDSIVKNSAAIADIKKDVDTRPTTETVHRLDVKVTELSGCCDSLERSVGRLEKIVDLFVKASVDSK